MENFSAIIIPTFNNEEYTIHCFDSIRKNTKNYKIIWIDNASNPESQEKVKKFLDKNNVPYELILNQENLGFVKATNQGMKRALELEAKYMILQNNDTEVYEGWLERMIKVAELDPKIGLVGPITSPCRSWQSIKNIAKKIPSFNNLSEYNNDPENYSKLIEKKYKNQSIETKIQLAFFCTLIKAETAKDIGFLSEEFGVGFGDDDDYCTRAMKKNWKSFIAKDVFVFHNHRTTFKSIYTRGEMNLMLEKNKEIFKRKHQDYLNEDNFKNKSFLDFFVEIYFDKNDAIFDLKSKKQDDNFFPSIDDFKDKNRVGIILRKNYQKRRVENLLKEAKELNYDSYIVSDINNEIYKINPNEEEWIKCFDNLKIINLIFIKKEISNFVCFISHSFKGGGSERSLVGMLDGLINRNIICHVFIPAHGMLEEEIKKRPVSYSVIKYPWWVKSNLNKITEEKTKIEVEKAEKSMTNEMIIFNPDVIYTNTSVINMGALISKKLNIPHIWHVREFVTKKRGLEFYQNFEKVSNFIYENSDKILFNSFAMKKHYENFIKSDKSEVIYNHIDESITSLIKKEKLNFFRNNRNLKMIMLGGVTPGKGQKDAILAVKSLVMNGIRDIELLIVGGVEPEYHRELRSIIEKNKLEEFVSFFGYSIDPFKILVEADLFLMCSQDEAFGRVTAEAILMKKPVIGARSGGTPELIQEGISGFLYEPENYEELAEKIKYFLEHKEKLEEFGLSGYNFAIGKFNEDQYSGRASEIIKELKNKSKNRTNLCLKQDNLNKFLKSRNKNKSLSLIKEKINRVAFLSKKALLVFKREGFIVFFSYFWKFIKYGRNYFR